LFGDSLIDVPAIEFNLAEKIQADLMRLHSNVAIKIFPSGIGGNRILDLKTRLFSQCLDAFYWQSVFSGQLPKTKTNYFLQRTKCNN